MKISAYLFSFLLISTFGCTSANNKSHILRHYATHVATDAAAQFTGAMSIAAGLVIGNAFAENRSNELAATSVLTGFAAALYTLYKTPQWTDTYILKYDTQRSTCQNILTCVCRILISFPLGTLLGELVVEKNLIEAQTKN